ncbi:hypothetical protein [Rhodococcus rhodochrous]|uniref:hypothetical protein n=1 Tax=Rhodococcus rhodochrous TaxID=1829 RepID=UPI0024BA60F0|nr:hypothetical protein [Rhodococcus rhodochrous]MDJ0399006.1 hypothetical protein [Rhodococcus rhodochrous]
MTDPEPRRVIAYVGPSTANSAADRYWTRIFDSVRRCIDTEASRTSRGFDALRTALSTADTAVTLVLDGTRLDEDVAEGIGTLLADEPTLRIVVATRTASSVGADMPSDTRILTSDDLAFTVDETAAYLRDAGVPQERWVVERIVHRTGGLPAVIGRLPAALSPARIPGVTETEHLDRIVDAVTDSVTARTIKNEPLLAHLLRPVLMSAMTDTLTCSSVAGRAWTRRRSSPPSNPSDWSNPCPGTRPGRTRTPSAGRCCDVPSPTCRRNRPGPTS